MAVKISSAEAYQESIHKLFPRGPYWDKQFADPKSDCFFFCKAKTDLIVRIRQRMSDLQNESIIQTAEETLDNWERVLLGAANVGMDITQRRTLLHASKAGNFSMDTIKEIGRTYGVSITNITFPFKPAFFGHSYFGIDAITSPAVFAVLFVYASQPDEDVQAEFEKQLISRVLSNYIVYFIYGGGV